MHIAKTGEPVGVTVQMEIIICCACSTPFAATIDFVRNRRSDGKSFYCPSGHSQSYTDNDAAKLKKAEAELAQYRTEKAKMEGVIKNARVVEQKLGEEIAKLRGDLAEAKKPVPASDMRAKIRAAIEAGKATYTIAKELGVSVNRVNGVRGGMKSTKAGTPAKEGEIPVKLPSTNPIAAAKAVVDRIIAMTEGS